MSKAFLTYNQQMRKLRKDKNINCNGSDNKRVLIRMGYFNIINGYKNPFICGTSSNGNHIYLPNTNLENLYELKKFDERLRLFLLRYITEIEEEVRTLTGYKFDQSNENGKISWYDTNAYSSSASLKYRMDAISSAYGELNKSQVDYVRYYMDNHTSIPTWIMLKVVNFSTFINVLKNSKLNVTHALCELYDMKDNNNKPNVKLLIGSLQWMRKVRNSCAHNERVYCLSEKTKSGNGRIKEMYINQMAKAYGKQSEKKVFDLLVYFKYYLPVKEYNEMMLEFQSMIEGIRNHVSQNAFDNIRGQMGIKRVEDLEILRTLSKVNINYNAYEKM